MDQRAWPMRTGVAWTMIATVRGWLPWWAGWADGPGRRGLAERRRWKGLKMTGRMNRTEVESIIKDSKNAQANCIESVVHDVL
jgi:hypothetical protein